MEHGATIVGASDEKITYASLIESKGQKGEILTYQWGKHIHMDGKEIYKYAVTDTVANIKKLLEREKIDQEQITQWIFHQSNRKIITSIQKRLQIQEQNVYTNIETVGNTFCASIPIALDDFINHRKTKQKDQIILLGYGGGLNLGSIVWEV